MKSMILVIIEQIKSFYLIRRLSLFELKSEHNNNYLGMAWEVLNPSIQIAIYYFVFDTLRSDHDVSLFHQKVPFFYWMLSGIIVWFFVNQATLNASKSVYQRIGMMSRMSFPMSVIPSIVIANKFYQHVILIVLVFIILQLTPFHATIYLVQLPYYIVCLLSLLVGFSLITSTFTTIVRDVQMIVQSLMKVLIYLSPILFVPRTTGMMALVVKLNPLSYVIEGYRASLIGGSWYLTAHPYQTLYFWVVVVFFFLFGSTVHVKFRSRFVDYL